MKKIISTTLLALFLSAGLVGCEPGHPVPEEAFKICSDKGGTPVYKSNAQGTKFSCVLPGEKLQNFSAN